MSVARKATILGLILFTGCTMPATRQDFEQRSALEQYVLSIVPLGAPVRLGGVNFLTNIHATFSRDGKPLPYREATIPVAHGQHGLVFQLESTLGDGPGIRYELIEMSGGSPVVLRFSSDAPLPDIALQAIAPPDLLPVRLAARSERETIHSIMGPAWFASCDGLYDRPGDRGIGISQPFQYSPSFGPDKQGLLGILMASGGERQLDVTFTLHKDLLKARFDYAPLPGRSTAVTDLRPAGWGILRSPGTAEAPELEKWLSGNLAFGGALTRTPPGGGVPELLWATAGTPGDVTSGPEGGQAARPPADWKKKLDKTRDIYRRVTERGEHYNWQHARELLATAIEDYWAHGIVRTNMPGPLLIGPPLSLEHARMWVSLMGLSGQTVVLGDALAQLPGERVELLRTILPPAPVRTTDLFAHRLPEQWVLTSTRDWQVAPSGTAVEPVMIVGLFNWSAEPRQMSIRLADLMPGLEARPGYTTGTFAVWDVWECRLATLVRDELMMPMQPASGRLLCIVPVADARPTLIGAGRHIAQGQLELKGLAWDAQQSTLRGAVDLPAHDSYELRCLLPEGEQSFEIEDVQAPGATVLIRRDGPVRRVTLTADRDLPAQWSIKFRKASQTFEPPTAPSGLNATQNTRGVLLAWNGQDGCAARYRVYRDGQQIAETIEPRHQDSTAEYGRQYAYTVSAIDYAGRESPASAPITHRTPVPASTNLTDLVPLVAEQEHLAVTADRSAAGNPLRVAGKRFHRGLGTHSNARICYYLGAGYENFTGEVGIDDETEGHGSCIFKILADGEVLFTSKLLRGGDAPQSFSVSVRDRLVLELIVTDGGDHPDHDHADWGNPYLQARVR
ncbi:MAG TPA: NPCBM/NEW2 domain-containing protein [Phycisphaerae bacterium]|nr:NPCBM/NEW2 domain-containing protein [Phycisphaerae bacterium]